MGEILGPAGRRDGASLHQDIMLSEKKEKSNLQLVLYCVLRIQRVLQRLHCTGGDRLGGPRDDVATRVTWSRWKGPASRFHPRQVSVCDGTARAVRARGSDLRSVFRGGALLAQDATFGSSCAEDALGLSALSLQLAVDL